MSLTGKSLQGSSSGQSSVSTIHAGRPLGTDYKSQFLPTEHHVTKHIHTEIAYQIYTRNSKAEEKISSAFVFT